MEIKKKLEDYVEGFTETFTVPGGTKLKQLDVEDSIRDLIIGSTSQKRQYIQWILLTEQYRSIQVSNVVMEMKELYRCSVF